VQVRDWKDGCEMPWCFDDVGTVCRFSKRCCREGNDEMDLGSLRGRFELIWGGACDVCGHCGDGRFVESDSR